MEQFFYFYRILPNYVMLPRLISGLILLYAVKVSWASHDNEFLPLRDQNVLFSLDEIRTEILSSALKSYDERNETVINPSIIVSSCEAFIDAYANVVASFAKCSILYARPLRFCQHCVVEYVTANTYSSVILTNTGIVDEKGKSCWQSISNSDRVQIIIKTVEFIDNLWKKCHCENCFDYARMVNSTVEYKLNNDTKTFFAKANKTWDCFRNTTEFGSDFSFVAESPHPDNISTCVRCADKYEDLNNFYKKLENKYNLHTCMDIVDLMNSTRSAWSNVYHCNQKPENLMPVFFLSGFFCLLPIVFYIGSKIHGTKVQNKLMKQRRLKDVTDGSQGNQSSHSDLQTTSSNSATQ